MAEPRRKTFRDILIVVLIAAGTAALLLLIMHIHSLQ